MSAIELGSGSLDILSTRHEDMALLGGLLEETKPLAFESGHAQTEWGKVGLWYSLAQASVLRPALRRPTPLTRSGLLEKSGGPAHNPSREIDEVGGNVMRLIMAEIRMPALVYIEEEKEWVSFNRESPGRQVSIAVDPLDETGPIKTGLRVQTAAATVTDQRGEFMSAAVASLVDDELILIENGSLSHLSFNERRLESDGMQALMSLPAARRERRDIHTARIAALPRRMQLLQHTPLFQNRFAPDLPTFGGYGLLAMIRGDIDVMLDPFKGQPWYEAVHWGNMAERSGLVVSDPEGNKIDFQGLLQSAIRGEETDRVKMVISSHLELHDQVLSGLQMDLQEAPV